MASPKRGGYFLALDLPAAPCQVVGRLDPVRRKQAVPKSINEWLAEGDQLYSSTLTEYHELETQLNDLEERLAGKLAELNRLAGVIGKTQIEGRKLAAPAGAIPPPMTAAPAPGGAPVVTGQVVDPHNGHNIPNSPANIARALTGRGIGR